MYHNYFFFSSHNSEPDYKVRKNTETATMFPRIRTRSFFQADGISHNMIYMGQKGEVRKQRPATRVGRAQGRCKCTKNSVSSRTRHKGCHGQGQGSQVTPPQRGQAPPSGLSVFENKNRTGNSVCLVAGAPPTPTAMPKSVHPVPSKHRAIPTNTHL